MEKNFLMEDMNCESEPILQAKLEYATQLLAYNKHFFSRDTEMTHQTRALQDIWTLELSSHVSEIPNDAPCVLQADWSELEK